MTQNTSSLQETSNHSTMTNGYRSSVNIWFIRLLNSNVFVFFVSVEWTWQKSWTNSWRTKSCSRLS